MTTDEKYIVFKRRDWDYHIEHCVPESMALDDAVVIRRGDVFAAPALDAYANNIRTAIEGIRMGMGDADLAVDHELLRRLQGIADYFHGQAAESWQTHRKLPD